MVLDEFTLRIIILAIGLIVIALVYFWSKRGRGRDHAKRNKRRDRNRERGSALDADIADSSSNEEVMVVDDMRVIDRTQEYMSERETKNKGDTVSNNSGSNIEPIEVEEIVVKKAEAQEQTEIVADEIQETPLSEPEPAPELEPEPELETELEPTTPSAPEPAEWTALLTVKATEDQLFHGTDIAKSCEALEFKLSDKGIWDCFFDGDRELDPIFSIAHMKEPGTFDRATIDAMQTPGLLMFCQLPGPSRPTSAVDFMIAAAGELARRLGGVVCDEKGNKMQTQSMIHLRSQAAEFEQRLDQMK